MKLSSKGRYGVRALFDIAFHRDAPTTQIKDIAARQAIPVRFLEQIFQDLKRAGLVTSKRGPRGGYQLARAPEEVRLGDIVRALEGPLGALFGEEAARKPASPRDPRRATDEIFRELAHEIEQCFDRVTLADVVRRAEALGGRRRGGASGYGYAI